jgi:V/A-type H+-transporting ATPase subunit E
MTIENIIKKIEAETKAEVNKILNDTQKEAKAIKLEAKTQIQEKLNASKKEGQKRITIIRNIHLSEARRNARRITLSAKEELINECFRQAKERLRNLKGDEYRRVLQKLINEALPHIGNKGTATLTREEDKSIIGSIPNISVKPKIIPGFGGLILESEDGKVVVDNTFKAILERKKDDIRTEVAKILYPDDDELNIE